jgi:hypothetical protein
VTLVLAHLWPGLALAAVLGAALGMLARWPGPRAFRLTAAAHLALLAGLAGGAALAPGRAGLWLEAGALTLAAYLIGAAAGVLVPRRATAD